MSESKSDDFDWSTVERIESGALAGPDECRKCGKKVLFTRSLSTNPETYKWCADCFCAREVISE